MPRGDKSSYTSKQKRQAEHIEEGYKKRGVPEKEALRRAWATENKISGGGRKGGPGSGKAENKELVHKGSRLSALHQSTAKRSSAGKKASAPGHRRASFSSHRISSR
jgi:hypothetical protein